jgi:hypothetical protein
MMMSDDGKGERRETHRIYRPPTPATRSPGGIGESRHSLNMFDAIPYSGTLDVTSWRFRLTPIWLDRALNGRRIALSR